MTSFAESPFGAELYVPPLSNKTLRNTLPETNSSLLLTRCQAQNAIPNPNSQRCRNKSYSVVARRCNPQRLVSPGLLQTSCFHVVIHVQQRPKSIPQSSLCRMSRKGGAIDVMKCIVRLHIHPVHAILLRTSVIPHPGRPDLLIPSRMFQITNEKEENGRFLNQKLLHPPMNLVHALSKVVASLLHLLKRPQEMFVNGFPECIIYNFLQLCKLS